MNAPLLFMVCISVCVCVRGCYDLFYSMHGLMHVCMLYQSKLSSICDLGWCFNDSKVRMACIFEVLSP